MKKYLLAIFAVVSILVYVTGCGGSGSGNSVTGPSYNGLATVRVQLNQNNTQITSAESAALYTPAAAMREGIEKAESEKLSARASMSPMIADGVYKPTSVDGSGNFEFTVPAGEYTFMASNGSARAVVTSIRAETSGETAVNPVVVDLTPTGSIEGDVIDPKGKAVAGAMVYLVKTSCVAFTDANGHFKMTGIPSDTKVPYQIAAIYTANNKHLTSASKDVTINSQNISVNLNTDKIQLEEISSDVKTIHTITGCVKNLYDSGRGVSGVVVMAVANGGTSVDFAVTGNDGSFSIPVKNSGSYTVSVLVAATPVEQITEVDSDSKAVAKDFILSYSGGQFVKGMVVLDSSYRGSSNLPQVYEDFLVHIVGSGTNYSAYTRAEYNYSTFSSSNGAEFTFCDVPAGEYNIFVDPQGNGFFGKSISVNVAEGLVVASDSIKVNYIKPSFQALGVPNGASEVSLQINETIPWMDTSLSDSDLINKYLTEDSVMLYDRTSSIQVVNELSVSGISSTGNVIATYPLGSPDAYLGNCIFTMTNTWIDEKTGLSGRFSVSQEVKMYDPNNPTPTPSVVNLNEVPAPMGTGIPYNIVRNSDGSFTAWNNRRGAYYYNPNEATGSGFQSIFMNTANIVLGASNKHVVCCDSTASTSLYITDNETAGDVILSCSDGKILAASILDYNNEIYVTVIQTEKATAQAGATAVDYDIYADFFKYDTTGASPVLVRIDVSNGHKKIYSNVASVDLGSSFNISTLMTADGSGIYSLIACNYNKEEKNFRIYNLNSLGNTLASDDLTGFGKLNSFTCLPNNCFGFGYTDNQENANEYMLVSYDGSKAEGNRVDISDHNNRLPKCFNPQGKVYFADGNQLKMAETVELNDSDISYIKDFSTVNVYKLVDAVSESNGDLGVYYINGN